MVDVFCENGYKLQFAFVPRPISDIIRIEPFRFEMREEALHRGIVITIPSARHADLDANLWQHVVVGIRRVLESLISVNDQSRHVFCLVKSILKGQLNLQILISQMEDGSLTRTSAFVNNEVYSLTGEMIDSPAVKNPSSDDFSVMKNISYGTD